MSAAVVTVLVVSVVTIVAGALGLRRARTTGDFYVASRAVTPRWNAIGGEYLSAASFLGVAGLILAYGYDALWYPVCYTAGYLILLAVVAAPLRRSGAYTLPDFAQIRLESTTVRRAAGALVVIIGWLYMVPQLAGASLTLSTQLEAPGWLGGLLVCLVVLIAVTAGGMRSITFAQAIQFWIKFVALLIPALVLIVVWQHRTTVYTGHPTAQGTVRVPIAQATTVRLPVTETLTVRGSVDGRPVDGPVELAAGSHRLGAGTTVTLHRDDTVPVVARLPDTTFTSWLTPLGSGIPHPLYASLSLILGVCLGTMGLPHVLVRFYTNTDGRDSRRTTFVVIVLLSAFYLLPTVLGTLGRRFVPDLLLTGETDATVLTLPERMLGGPAGVWLGALVTAGAFAAFLSTVSGLAVSVAGVLGQGLVGDRLRAPRRLRIRSFRLSAILALAIPYVLSLRTERLGLAVVVALAFTVAASTFCPLLVLGIWWDRLTDAGALAGMAVGGTLSLTAALATLTGEDPAGWPGAVLGQPAVWTVPISFAVMTLVSLASADRVPAAARRIMIRLHTPEAPVPGGH
jgi:Na+(H+)/acetate symporter ActP